MFANPLRVFMVWGILLSVPTAGFASSYLLLSQRLPKRIVMALPPGPVTGKPIPAAMAGAGQGQKVILLGGVRLAAEMAPPPAAGPAPNPLPTIAVEPPKALGLTATPLAERLRVVLSVDAPVSTAYAVGPNGRSITLALPDLRWSLPAEGSFTGAAPLAGYRYVADKSGTGGVLTLTAAETLDLAAVTPMQPDADGGYRLVVDLQRGTATNLARRGGFLTWEAKNGARAAPRMTAEAAPRQMGTPPGNLAMPAAADGGFFGLAPDGWIAAPAEATGLAAQRSDDRTRVTLALSGPTSYSYGVSPEGLSITLAMPQAVWRLPKEGRLDGAGRVAGWKVMPNAEGNGGALIVENNAPLDIVAVTPLRPEGGEGWRLIVDLQDSKPLVRRGGMVLWLTKSEPKETMASLAPDALAADDGPRLELAAMGGRGGGLPEMLPVAPELRPLVDTPLLLPNGFNR